MEFSRQEYWSGLPFPSPGGGGGLVAKLCPTLATCELGTYQAPRSMGFFRQEYWSGLPFPFPGDLPNSEIKPWSPALQILSRLSHHGCPRIVIFIESESTLVDARVQGWEGVLVS